MAVQGFGLRCEAFVQGLQCIWGLRKTAGRQPGPKNAANPTPSAGPKSLSPEEAHRMRGPNTSCPFASLVLNESRASSHWGVGGWRAVSGGLRGVGFSACHETGCADWARLTEHGGCGLRVRVWAAESSDLPV